MAQGLVLPSKSSIFIGKISVIILHLILKKLTKLRPKFRFRSRIDMDIPSVFFPHGNKFGLYLELH
jgi:hypothetical protein